MPPLLLLADGGQKQSECGGDQPLERAAPRQNRHHAKTPEHHHEQFRRPHQVNQRSRRRYGRRQSECPDQRAHAAGHERRPQGAPGLAPLAHRIAVQDRCLRAGAAGNAEQHGKVRGADGAHGTRADEQRHAGHRLPFDHHRQHDGVNQWNAQALWRHGGKGADAHPDKHREEYFEVKNIHEPFYRGVDK